MASAASYVAQHVTGTARRTFDLGRVTLDMANTQLERSCYLKMPPHLYEQVQQVHTQQVGEYNTVRHHHCSRRRNEESHNVTCLGAALDDEATSRDLRGKHVIIAVGYAGSCWVLHVTSARLQCLHGLHHCLA